MIYADPSYISPDQESKAWDKINWDKVTSTGWISESIDDDPKNLGKLYSASYSYHDHEAFLKAICAAKSRVLISNYDLQLYDYYLTPELGWRKMEYNTFTSVGNKAGNSRAEVLWYNF